MIIASAKRRENIAEYLIYMWHIEDLIRANDLDIDKIKSNVISRFNVDDSQKREMEEWYESLIDMMRREGVAKSGHLQINNNVLNQLVQLHQALLKDPKFPEYTSEFYRTLPFIVELRSKAGGNQVGEIETCFTALYGLLLMRLQHKELTENTQKAITQISKFIALLSHDFHLDEEDKLFKHDDDVAAPTEGDK
jgi:flagellin-specific chaperone FliS